MPIKVTIVPTERMFVNVHVRRPNWQQFLHY